MANGPAWHDRFPGMEFKGGDPDAFIAKDDVAQYFVDYVREFNLPVRTGVEVKVRCVTTVVRGLPLKPPTA